MTFLNWNSCFKCKHCALIVVLRKTSTASRDIFNILVFVRGTEHVFCKAETNFSNILFVCVFWNVRKTYNILRCLVHCNLLTWQQQFMYVIVFICYPEDNICQWIAMAINFFTRIVYYKIVTCEVNLLFLFL